MNKFIVVIFPNAAMTNQGISILKKLHAEGGIKLYASTVLARDSSGKLSVKEVTKEGLGGTAVGAFIGGLAGLRAWLELDYTSFPGANKENLTLG